MVVKQLHTVTSRRGSIHSDVSVEKQRNISMQVRGAFAVFVLLGLTWAMAGQYISTRLFLTAIVRVQTYPCV